MLHVLMDTSVFRSNPPRKKPIFKSIVKVSRNNELKLHVPELVKREFLSQNYTHYKNDFEDLEKGLNGLLRRSLPEDLENNLEKFQEDINNYPEKIRKHINDEFDDWLDSIQSKKYKITLKHTRQTFDKYFLGDLPFEERKNRKDIPDSFICECIEDVIQEVDHLHIVAGDKAIEKTFKERSDVNTWSSLEEFIDSSDFQELLQEHNAKNNFISFVEYLGNDGVLFDRKIEEEIINILHGMNITSPKIKGENNEGRVSMVGNPEDIKYLVDDIVYYGDGRGVIPFKFKIECILGYSIYKPDYLALGEEDKRKISRTELNDHYYYAEKSLRLSIKGNLSIEASLNLLEEKNENEKIANSLDEEAVQINEIENIEILPNGSSAKERVKIDFSRI
ncbi:PIN domain-containing protein [Halanaerobaculum tunisiense]